MMRQICWAVFWALVTLLFLMTRQGALEAQEVPDFELVHRMAGSEIGVERVFLGDAGEGLARMRTEAELDFGRGPMTLGSELVWRSGTGDARSYHLDVQVGGGAQELSMERVEGKAAFKAQVAGSEIAQEQGVTGDLVVLDNMIGGHYLSLLDWIDAHGEGGELTVAVPQPMQNLPGSVQREPDARGRFGGVLVPVDVHTLQVANLVVTVRSSSKVPHRLLEIEVPVQKYRITRKGYEAATEEGPGPPEGIVEEELRVETPEGYVLGATLSLPAQRDGLVPGVVLVHGSGPNDRDETIARSKPFRDLAWGLAQRGVAVLRYDKRTFALRDQLPMEKLLEAIDSLDEIVVRDAVAALETLRDTGYVDPRSLYVVGHSMGGLALPWILEAAPWAAGGVVLAGPARGIDRLIEEQTRYLLGRSGLPEEAVQQRMEALQEELRRLRQGEAEGDEVILGAPAAFWQDLMHRDPAAEAAALPHPILYLRGGKDYQVTSDDQALWMRAAEEAGKRNAAFKVFPDLNHLFFRVEGESDSSDYQRGGSVEEQVIAEVATWIRERTDNQRRERRLRQPRTRRR